MNDHSGPPPVKTRREHGPQGTQRIAPDQVSQLLEAAASGNAADRAQLIGMGENIAGRTFPLRAERITIGRSRICDIHIDEPSLSSEHARLDRDGGGWRIVNLLSTNGVFVNGEKVFAHRLGNGDVIGLGKIRLRFEDSGARQRRTGGFSTAGWHWAILAAAAAIIAGVAWLVLG